MKKHKARRVVLGKNLVSSSLYTMYVRCEFQYQSFPSLLFFKHLLIWLHQVLAVAHRLFVAACRLLSSCSTRASDHMGSPVVSHTGLVASWHVRSSQSRGGTKSPALEGRLLTTEPPGKSLYFHLCWPTPSFSDLSLWNVRWVYSWETGDNTTAHSESLNSSWAVTSHWQNLKSDVISHYMSICYLQWSVNWRASKELVLYAVTHITYCGKWNLKLLRGWCY